jgi:hypothetical protein
LQLRVLAVVVYAVSTRLGKLREALSRNIYAGTEVAFDGVAAESSMVLIQAVKSLELHGV